MTINTFKILFLIGSCFFLETSISAQYKFGVHGGVGISNYVGKDFSAQNESKMGIIAGVFYEREINFTLSIGAELTYEKKGTSYEFYPKDATVVFVDSRMTYLSLPVLIKAYFGQQANYYIYTGLTGSYLTGYELSHSATEYGYTISSEPFFPYKFNNWDASITAGFGLNIYEVILDIRYHHGVVNVYEGHHVPSIRNHFISATIGFTLYKKKVLSCYNHRRK